METYLFQYYLKFEDVGIWVCEILLFFFFFSVTEVRQEIVDMVYIRLLYLIFLMRGLYFKFLNKASKIKKKDILNNTSVCATIGVSHISVRFNTK